MKLSPETLIRIKEGRQTVVLVLTEPTERPGRPYKLEKASDAQITVRGIEERHVGSVTAREAKRCGYSSLKDLWKRMGTVQVWKPQEEGVNVPIVWLVTFDLGDTTDKPRLLRAGAPSVPTCKARVTRNGRTMTCGRGFADKQDVCVCGAKRPGETVDDHGYTSRQANKLAGEPEAVSDGYLTRFREDSDVTKMALESQEWAERRDRLQAVIRDLQADPKVRQNRGALENVRGLERQVRALDRKLAA